MRVILLTRTSRLLTYSLVIILCTCGLTFYFLLANDSDDWMELKLLEGPTINPCEIKNENPDRLPKCVNDAEPSMLTSECNGRLGNQMFSYATMFAISQYNNRLAFMSPSVSSFVSKYFKVSVSTLNQSLYESILWSEKTVGGIVDDSIRNLAESHLKLVGVPQSWKYFDDIRPLILQEFQFHDYIVRRTELVLEEIREGNGDIILVGIHVRRGDYVISSKIGGFHIPEVEFYNGAMGYFQDKFKDQQVTFVVASDDNDWCTQNLKLLTQFRIHILSGTPEDMPGLDLAVLSHCDHVIFGLGTFGFWAAYLNYGKVIYCSDCITPNAFWLRDRAVYNGDYGNVVLPDWIGFSREGKRTNASVLAKTTDLI